MCKELIRTIHVYQLEDGAEEEVERDYVEGRVNAVWLCMYVFDADRHRPPNLDHIPPILSISRHPIVL
ncbi:hypothetical protein F0562_006791 [Nyssa sinensis]|uniref:Uncharacterized protein n=1 Tax=Nyssa sinensis TaxID=561372 RepID=A0A5J5ARR9_9ASTE|nr:hypothetical protein F0562_006791 [Nyssa sinensis]